MSLNNLSLEITEKTFIKKYAEGIEPNNGQPYEIVEGPNKIYKGQDAYNRLIELGYSNEQIEKMREANNNGTN